MSSTVRILSAAPPPLAEDDSPPRALVIDDEPAMRQAIRRSLEARGWQIMLAASGAEGMTCLQAFEADVVLVDYMMAEMDGLEVMRRVKERRAQLPVVMMTGSDDVQLAVDAMKQGAYDFIPKPLPPADVLHLNLAKAVQHSRLTVRTRKLEQRLATQARYGDLVGSSPAMQGVYRFIDGVAQSESPVLVLGESGTGKELVARAIHRYSRRSERPLVCINCAAIAGDLVESELFGHVRGAFTGASVARAGLFESAHQNTLFLDEIGDLPLGVQAQLLRALQQGEIKRVGADEVKIVDVRVIAATNVDLKERAEKGAFRKDLYFRLNVLATELPPLRDRGDDVLLLAQRSLEQHNARSRDTKTFARDAIEALVAYDWPGNVRELENAIERACVLSRSPAIGAADLPSAATASHAASGADPSQASWASSLWTLPYPEAKRRALTSFDETYVREALLRAGGNVTQAAKLAGLDRSNFRRVAQKLKSVEAPGPARRSDPPPEK